MAGMAGEAEKARLWRSVSHSQSSRWGYSDSFWHAENGRELSTIT